MAYAKRLKDLSPEEQARKRIDNRRKFKACVRLVIANLFWLQDADEGEEFGVNVQKNIALLMKRKKDNKSLLSYKDKVILTKDPEERTDEEKRHLFRILGNLKCFRKYPYHVKMELAAVCRFVYFPPHRVIVRQDGEGTSLYFIMSGSVAVTMSEFDSLLNEYEVKDVGTMETGQMFGEVSLLHDIPRTATITTLTHCEMILLLKKDFNKVLKKSLQAVWDEILSSMARFHYFDGWDEVSMRECCIYSKMAQYRLNDVVFGCGVHSDNYVHFVLKGQCRMIEELPVIETNYGACKTYKLFDREAYRRKMMSQRQSVKSITSRYSVPLKSDGPRTSKARKKPLELILSDSTVGSTIEKPAISVISSVHTSDSSKITSDGRMSDGSKTIGSIRPSTRHNSSETDVVDVGELMRQLGILIEDEKEFPLPPYVKVIFMQVCLFNELSCFGIGENLRYRKIVASTDVVECLLIPKFWIWQKNKSNVWSTVVHTLKKLIPTTQQVFDIFLENRKWGKWKRELVNDIVRKIPCNVRNNIPYSVRLAEDIDYGVWYKAV